MDDGRPRGHRDAEPTPEEERARPSGTEEGASQGGSRRAPRLLDSSLGNEALPERARCPFCEGRDTEQFSAFGSAVSTSQYYCRRCRTVFEFMKRRGRG